MQNISESLKRQREQILADTSEEMLSRHTSLLEIAVISLHNRLVNRMGPDAEQFRSNGAVLAAGGFGRGLAGPNRPISLLFLRADGFPWKEEWIEEITQPLSEAGWILSPHHGAIDELIGRSEGDLEFFMSFMETRYISGSRPLVDQLDKALETFLNSRREELLTALFHLVRSREARLEESETWLEPDLMYNPGALWEISAIRAACRVASNIRSLDDAIFRGYLVRREVDHLQQAEKTFARLLSLLRAASDAGQGVLHFEEQEQLADKLGYSGRAGFLPVESFMQHIYQLFHGVVRISREFWERLQETRQDLGESETASQERIEEGLWVYSSKIHLQTDRYPASPGHLVHLFRLAAEHGLGFANVTRQWIQHHSNALDAAAGDPMVHDDLLHLLRFDTFELPVLRRFYDLGFLSSLIPELAAVHGLVQHDAFHLYPVHEHHLRTLTELKRLMLGHYSSEEPELTAIAQNLEDPTCLFLAGLLHDIGKSSGRGHARHGGEMIPAIARRLGLVADEAEAVQFLVAHHLLLTDSASMRDLADAEMLLRCASVIRTPERLDLLALLSFADMAATGPKAIQKWRDTPVISLCQIVRHILEKGEPSQEAITEKIEHIREQVARELSDVMDRNQLENFFTQMAPRYLLSMMPGAIARHVRLQWQLQHSGERFVCEVLDSDGVAELTLVSWDAPGLLYRVAGVLTLQAMNIMQAQVFTMNNGIALLIFQCRPVGGQEVPPDWEAIKVDMQRLLLGRMALDYRIAAHAAAHDQQQSPVRYPPSRILIDNDSSASYTILEVYTVDRVGLLYKISRTLYELQVRIYVAKITTKVDQVADVFYIRTQQGEKVVDLEQIQEIRNALCFWLDGPGECS